MGTRRLSVTVTTAADGTATGYSDTIQHGHLSQVRYVADGSTPYDNTADFTITLEATGEALLSQTNVSASFTKAPRQATHDVSGVAALYAAAGQPVNDKIAIANDRIKVAIAQGGNTKTGVFHFVID